MTLLRKLIGGHKALAALTVLGSLVSIGLSLGWNALLRAYPTIIIPL